MNDPAVDIWGDAWRELTGRDLPPRPADRRTPAEVARDDALEDIAEERAWYRRNGGTGDDADEAADRYYDNEQFEKGWN